MMGRARRTAGMTFVEIAIASAVLTVIMTLVYMVLLRSASHAATQTTAADLDAQCRQILADVTRDLREADNVQFDPANTVLVGPVTGQNGASTRVTLTKVAGFNPFSANAGAGASYSADGTVVWETAPLEGPPNGVDNDRDGLVDQCAVRRTDGTGARTLSSRGTSRVGNTWPALAGIGDMVPRWPANQRPPGLYFAFSTWDPDGPFDPATNLGSAPVETRPLIHVVVTLQGVDARGRPLVRSLTAKVTLRNPVRPPAP